MNIELDLEGDDGQISVENLQGALSDLLDLLRRASEVAEVGQQTWRVSGLRAGSAHVAMTAPEASNVGAVLRAGLSALREQPAIPDGWTRPMVKRVLDLGRRAGSGGVTAVGVRVGGKSDKPRLIDAVVTDHAQRALGGRTATRGSIRGSVKRWTEQGRREIGIVRSVEARGSVPASYPAELAPRILSQALGHEIEAWGTIYRNDVGQITAVRIEDFTVLDDRPAPRSIAEMRGVMQDEDGTPLIDMDQWLRDRHG